MKIDINEFVTFLKLKNGNYKLKYDDKNEVNIAKYLQSIGYGTTELNSKRIFFKRENNDIIPVYFGDIKRVFYQVIRSFEYKNLPENISPIDIMNWCLTKQPVKKNNIFRSILKDNLSEDEKHLYLLKANLSYNEEFKIQKLLSKLSELEFNEITNHKNGFFRKGNIHYKKLKTSHYLLFIQSFNKNLRRFQFECYETEFNNELDIAFKSPNKFTEISLCFDIERDYSKIVQHLN